MVGPGLGGDSLAPDCDTDTEGDSGTTNNWPPHSNGAQAGGRQ